MILTDGFRGKERQTALTPASRRCHVAIVHVLLEARADMDVANLNGSTALMCACEKGQCPNCASVFGSRVWTGMKSSDGDTAL